MKSLGKAAILTASLALAAPCWGQATTAQQPAVAYAADGILYLATESGRVAQTIETELPIGDFAISPDLKTVVFSLPHPGESGGLFFILDVATGAIERMPPDPYFNDASVADLVEFYADPDFSPDGERVVFATHANAVGDEVQTSGPLAILDLKTREVTILKSTVGESGLPLGFVRDPHWSPDGRLVLATIEGHAFVMDSGGQDLAEAVIPESEFSQSPQSYGMYAIGWLGSRCVLYQAGDDPEHDPTRILNLSTGRTSSAAEMLRLPEPWLRGVRGSTGRLWARSDPEGFRIEGPGISWVIRGDAETVYVRLLRQGSTEDLAPSECK
jgi:hypothetical protein